LVGTEVSNQKLLRTRPLLFPGDHQNIRNFIKTGWGGIIFEGNALMLKKE